MYHDKADKGRGRKTTSGNGQAWRLASPRGQWRIEKMEKTGCKIICGAPTTLAVKGLMLIMMSADYVILKLSLMLSYGRQYILPDERLQDTPTAH